MKTKTTVIVAAAAVLCVGVFATARAQVETRQVLAFSKIRVENGIDVELRQTDRENLRIEVDGVDLEDVRSEVVDDELRLSRESRFFQSGRVRAYVDFVRLTEIAAASGSDLASDGALQLEDLTVTAASGSDIELEVAARDLEFHVSSGSDLEVEGMAETLSIEASSGSDVSAEDLRAGTVSLRLASGSDAEVYAADRIDIDARSGSDVTVHGDPATRNVDADRSSDVVWD